MTNKPIRPKRIFAKPPKPWDEMTEAYHHNG
jgi:hypothetical protein